ncbi:arabinogalactan oligomer/maltooligosaccharide transport system substrate-binding protein [Streptomyces sp. SAI-208]|uniref:extracellular solute-binding protein n=1 Tax=unclassified Streptomyces TaxID=2593676 RepID=UPI0024730B19|nr:MULTISPECIES: extracellular solute-binding protein [unclassified Streptomyces]MDH6519534.1 arabinogalactan oligomer/maltooligosaccharide transport system substrate-binding protein [Streptomyces sp. SAI-090]MDH6551743.1 arabinogalactan oligomer/maltooligosaccharide transport system substrate-binding protein [Streptomyces sp. SAI-041]MDH6570833.1 arabinogalactan oligomer/maltooligosaccharide transport system substrate-binding protein [Streptomyces sp. SAI-117]MDH6584199.1 arabinogalactan oligo
MRRGIAATALVASFALAATACGGSDSGDKADGPVTITWWDTSNATNEAPTYKALIKDFEAANKNIKVKYVNVQFDQAQNKFDTAAGASGAPDVLRSEVGWTPAFAKKGYFLPLDGTEALADQAKFKSNLIEQAKYDGKTYGVPLVTDTLALVYNKQLFAKAGVEAPKTWDDLKKAAATIKDKTGVDGYWGSTQAYYAQTFLYGEGTDTVDASAKKITVNSAAAKKGYGTWLSLFSGKGLHKADTTADAYAHIQDAFVNGKVAAIIQGPWEITNFYKGSAFADKNNLGIATVPAGSTGKAGAPTGGHNLSVYAGSDAAHQKAALKFVNFMTSAKSQSAIALKNSTLPTRDDAYTDQVKADPGIAGYGTVLAAAQPRPALPEYSSLWGPLDTELPKVAGGKESLDKGLSNAETAIAKLVPDFSK